MRKLFFYFIILSFLIFVFLTSVVFAADNNNWLGGGTTCLEISLEPFIKECPDSPADYISGLYKLAVFGAIVSAVVIITIAGGIYATSGDNSSREKEAKDQIRDALTGLVLILCSVLLLRTINPALVSLSLPGIDVKFKNDGNWRMKEQAEQQKKLLEKCIKDICNKVDDSAKPACQQACESLYGRGGT